jgi:hypothetical protein
MSVTTKITFNYDTVDVRVFSDGSIVLVDKGVEVEISKQLLSYMIQVQHKNL